MYIRFCNKKQIEVQKTAANLRKQVSQIKESSALLYMRKCKSGLIEIIPLVCTLAIWGRYPVLSHPESQQNWGEGWMEGSLQGLAARWWESCFYLEFPQVSPSGWL